MSYIKRKTHKSIFVPCLLLLFLLIMLLSIAISCVTKPPQGNISSVNVIIGHSDVFSHEEIKSAINCIKADFAEYRDCKLEELRYTEKDGLELARKHLEFTAACKDLDVEDVIVFFGQFTSGEKGHCDKCFFYPCETYSNSIWVLIKNDSSQWKIISRLAL